MAIDFKALEKLIQIAKKYKLGELEVEDGKSKYRVQTARGVPTHTAGWTQVPTAINPRAELDAASVAQELTAAVANAARAEEGKYSKVSSPFVGTFYRSPSPDAEPYVKEGQTVRKGEVLCIVEAMKLMNEIESEVSGRVISVLAENGQPVEYGEPLFLIDPV